uniref:C-type lectin domain-containing protein n=1 Tax=Oryzias latipes TaxID=8090 RepID=A0A3P9IKK2_ORYLA
DEGKRCPEGWKRFGCSCYYKSTEKRNWYNSRSFCQKNGSDLVVVNSKEEQVGVFTLVPFQLLVSWILHLYVCCCCLDVNGMFYHRFLDESISKDRNKDDAVFLSTEGKWKQQDKTNFKNWICEKNNFGSFCSCAVH